MAKNEYKLSRKALHLRAGMRLRPPHFTYLMEEPKYRLIRVSSFVKELSHLQDLVNRNQSTVAGSCSISSHQLMIMACLQSIIRRRAWLLEASKRSHLQTEWPIESALWVRLMSSQYPLFSRIPITGRNSILSTEWVHKKVIRLRNSSPRSLTLHSTRR